MIKVFTVSAGYYSILFEAIIAEGYDREALEKKCEITTSELNREDCRVPGEKSIQLWNVALSFIKNPAFALHFGASTHYNRVNIISMILDNCETFREAFQTLTRFGKLADSNGEPRLIEKEDSARLVHHFHNPSYDQCMSEVFFARLTMAIERNTTEPFLINEIRFRHSQPHYFSEYKKIFTFPVFFDQSENALIFPKGNLDITFKKPNNYLKYVLELHSKYLLKQPEFSGSWTNKVRNIIIENLPTTHVNKLMVSNRLNPSSKTLYRYLKDEGVTFKNLLDSTRKYLAISYLSSKKYSSSEIAFFLGYTDNTSYYHAIKRWKSQTPCDFPY